MPVDGITISCRQRKRKKCGALEQRSCRCRNGLAYDDIAIHMRMAIQATSSTMLSSKRARLRRGGHGGGRSDWRSVLAVAETGAFGDEARGFAPVELRPLAM